MLKSTLIYSTLALIFLVALWLIASPQTNLLDFALLALASFRLGRLIARDKIALPLRAPFVDTYVDLDGENVVPKNEIGELLTCPICAGTWAALGLVAGLSIYPEFTYSLILVMAAAGVVDILVKWEDRCK